MKKLFDEKTGFIALDEMVLSRPSYLAVVEDGVVSPEEIERQTERVINLLKQIDEVLSESDRELVIDALCELSVLIQLSNKQ